MYNFVAMWRILEEILACEPIATLRDGWNENENENEMKKKTTGDKRKESNLWGGFSQQEVPGNSREKPAIEPKEPHGLTYHKSSLI